MSERVDGIMQRYAAEVFLFMAASGAGVAWRYYRQSSEFRDDASHRLTDPVSVAELPLTPEETMALDHYYDRALRNLSELYMEPENVRLVQYKSLFERINVNYRPGVSSVEPQSFTSTSDGAELTVTVPLEFQSMMMLEQALHIMRLETYQKAENGGMFIKVPALVALDWVRSYLLGSAVGSGQNTGQYI